MSFLSLVSLAYVGPGAGLGAVGALFAVLAAVVLGLVGLVLYPIQLIRKWIAGRPPHGVANESKSDRAPAA